MRYVTVVPAYGRDYKSKKAALADWYAGEDFLIQDFQLSGYVSIRDRVDNTTFNIRYDRLTKVVPVRATTTPKAEKWDGPVTSEGEPFA